MADDNIRVGMSRVCAEPSTKGQRHPGCSGGICNCPCHGVRAPGNFRDRVRQRQLRTPDPDERGEAPPGSATSAGAT